MTPLEALLAAVDEVLRHHYYRDRSGDEWCACDEWASYGHGQRGQCALRELRVAREQMRG